jgi:hypothetical protein
VNPYKEKDMNKRILGCTLVPLVLMVASTAAMAQSNPRGTAKLQKGGEYVMVEYGRPSLKGRDMITQIAPGKVWRMGADKSTTLTSSANLSFGKVSIPSGSYSLWLRKVDEKNFNLVFNKTTGQWGTEHDATQDLASVPLTMGEGNKSVEQFTINLKEAGKGGELELLWGTITLKAPFTFK